MKKEDFNTRLKPFDDLYSVMRKEIRNRLEAMTESELNQIKIDAGATSPTNCAWTTYEVAKIVREIAQWVEGVEGLRNAIETTESPSPKGAAAEGKG